VCGFTLHDFPVMTSLNQDAFYIKAIVLMRTFS